MPGYRKVLMRAIGLYDDVMLPFWLAGVGAVVLGIESEHLLPVVIALATLAPLVAHIRHVGWHNLLAEPSAATIIVWFYFALFPLRGLVIAASGYNDVFFGRGVVPSSLLASELLLASFGTTILLESYYWFLGPTEETRPTVAPHPAGPAVVRLATLLTALALLALVGVIVQYGGVHAAQSALLAHSVASALQGETSVPGSVWSIFSVPAVWAASYVAVNRGGSGQVRALLGLCATVIVIASLVVYGSRLNALLALMGVWIVLYYSGRRISTRAIIAAAVAAVLISQPILSARPGGTQTHISSIERLSRIVGYDALDVALDVRQDSGSIKQKFDNSTRWLQLPAYFVPSILWHGRPILFANRLGLYVAQTIGNANDQATGFPSTYITEGWLIGGWLATFLLSLAFGAFLGWTRRRLVGAPAPSAAAVLTYCFVVTLGWTYYKDGDMVATVVGQGRTAAYLGLLLLATGVIGARKQGSGSPGSVPSPVARPL